MESITGALQVMRTKKIALFVLTYNAESHIRKTLSRIPKEIRDEFSEIFLSDDSSSDRTLDEARAVACELGLRNFISWRTPKNQGYGGNQKIGYAYALERNFDVVIMLHGDGQYPPERLPEIIAEFSNDGLGAVFGSRMINRRDALRGGMPSYKFLGNQVLTAVENKILGTALSEFHSGYRAYTASALSRIPFLMNSDDFHFDTDIIVQLVASGAQIKEIPMPTFYGDEECHVDGFRYAWDCLKSVVKYRLHSMGIFYQPNFDVACQAKRNYDLKSHRNSLHYYVEHMKWHADDIVADIGANDGRFSQRISKRVGHVCAVDIQKPDAVGPNLETMEFDLNGDFPSILGRKRFDAVIALDVVEHLIEPEEAAKKLNMLLRDGGYLLASTANVAFFIMRFTLLIGWFNYGKRGILDRTHHRLFTVNSFRRLLENAGFDVETIVGFGPPIADQISSQGIVGRIDWVLGKLARLYPPMFAFNYLLVAKKRMEFGDTYDAAISTAKRTRV